MASQKKLTNEEIAAFCRQAAIIFRAGIQIESGIEIMANDTESPEGKAILLEVAAYCEQGYKFYQALEETGVFPKYVVKLVSLGDETGRSDEVLSSLADYYDRENNVSEGIRSAVTYPLIMIAMMFIIILILVAKVLPIFKQVFVQLGTEMTPLAEKLVSLGSSLSNWAVGLTVTLMVLLALFICLMQIPAFKKRVRSIMTSFPLTRNFYDNVSAGRFAEGMYLTYSSGMDIFMGLEMVSEMVENIHTEKKIEIVRKELLDGKSFPEALAASGIFSNLYCSMISVAYKGAGVEDTLKYIATLYDEHTDKQLNRILSIIEPTLVIILSLIVGAILLSVLLPLMGIMSSIG